MVKKEHQVQMFIFMNLMNHVVVASAVNVHLVVWRKTWRIFLNSVGLKFFHFTMSTYNYFPFFAWLAILDGRCDLFENQSLFENAPSTNDNRSNSNPNFGDFEFANYQWNQKTSGKIFSPIANILKISETSIKWIFHNFGFSFGEFFFRN